MNFYRCSSLSNSPNNGEVNISFIWANSESEAKAIYIKEFKYRKNKKGINIDEIVYVSATRIPKVVEELATYKIDSNGNHLKALTKVSRICCSRCGQVASNNNFCTFCNAQFK